MATHSVRIASDKFDKRMGSNYTEYKEIPVDLYGKMVFPNKDNPSNLEDAAQDIREYYGLTGEDGLRGKGRINRR